MRRVWIAALAAAGIATGGAVQAQLTIEISPEQRTVIKEYVVKQRVRPARITERIAVGAVLPTEVELVAVPSDWGPSLARYRYIYWDDRVVLVEPSSRRVIRIID
jgi:hypothetical protein